MSVRPRYPMRIASALIAVLLLVTPSFAWNNPGHMTVVKLAWDQLDAKERTALYALLQNHPHWDRFFKVIKQPTTVPEQDFLFALGGTWPDWLRSYTKKGDEEGKKIALFHKGPRHYVNWPYVWPRDAAEFKDKKLPGPDPKDDVVHGIDTVLAELMDPAKHSPKYRAVSLCWLLHLTGDIHQPLHNIGVISKYTPLGDQGGNLFWVKSQGFPTRLHTYWDDLPGAQESYASGYDKCVANCALLTRAEYAREKLADDLKKTTPMEWSKDAFALAVKVGYRSGDLKGRFLAFGKDTDEEKAKAPELPANYHDQALATANRQCALAGYRLAEMLHKVAKVEMKE
jgi:S1/P1 Nuclease